MGGKSPEMYTKVNSKQKQNALERGYEIISIIELKV
jgi:hypothetical protein